MAGNIIHICGPEHSGKIYMALGLAERLDDFDISHIVFNVEDFSSAQKKLLKSGKITTLVIDEPKKVPHPTVSKYKLVETIIQLASRGNNIIMTGYPGEGIYDALVEMAMKFVASRDINIIGINLHSHNDPSYLKVLGIAPSKSLLDSYNAKFKEIIKQ